LLDNCDLAQLLGVTQRTIARYREKGLIRYYQTDENGKNFYRSSEIQDFLRQRGKKK
jgi:DNA-binding transcriptional MerR regulator